MCSECAVYSKWIVSDVGPSSASGSSYRISILYLSTSDGICSAPPALSTSLATTVLVNQKFATSSFTGLPDLLPLHHCLCHCVTLAPTAALPLLTTRK